MVLIITACSLLIALLVDQQQISPYNLCNNVFIDCDIHRIRKGPLKSTIRESTSRVVFDWCTP